MIEIGLVETINWYARNVTEPFNNVRGVCRAEISLKQAWRQTILDERQNGYYHPSLNVTLTSKEYFDDIAIHERKVVEHLRWYLDSEDVFADVGSYSGAYSLIADNSGADCYAFELSTEHCSLIQENAALNDSKVTVCNAAVTDHSGETRARTDLGVESRITVEKPVGESVAAVTLDEYFTNRPDPTVLKIDVEGAAGNVLRGAERILRESRPVCYIELHDDTGEHPNVCNVLERFSYEIETIMRKGEQEMVVCHPK